MNVLSVPMRTPEATALKVRAGLSRSSISISSQPPTPGAFQPFTEARMDAREALLNAVPRAPFMPAPPSALKACTPESRKASATGSVERAVVRIPFPGDGSTASDISPPGDQVAGRSSADKT